METRTKEAQMISLAAALIIMFAMGMTPLLVLGHRGAWTTEALLVPVGFLVSGTFALAVLMRAQKLRPGESILSGRFGLVIAVVALVVLLAIGALVAGSVASGHVAGPARAYVGGFTAVVLGVGYLARRIYENVTRRDEVAVEKQEEEHEDD
jgi:hypothetical protein